MDALALSISHTTRKPRPGERDGVNYHFTDVAAFESLVSKGAFLEHANVFGNYYGTAIDSVRNPLAAGIDLILEIDWQGAAQIRSLLPGVISIFILPPSLVTLEKRLRARGQDDDTVIWRRLSMAVEEMSHCFEYDYLVVNDEFSRAADDLVAIVRAERLRRTPQEAALKSKLRSLLDTRTGA
jgi:guanylate kinase